MFRVFSSIPNGGWVDGGCLLKKRKFLMLDKKAFSSFEKVLDYWCLICSWTFMFLGPCNIKFFRVLWLSFYSLCKYNQLEFLTDACSWLSKWQPNLLHGLLKMLKGIFCTPAYHAKNREVEICIVPVEIFITFN